jgi:hypothetical protein
MAGARFDDPLPLQRAEGYLHTFVRGQETYAAGEPTDALPGRLIRGARPAPAPP